jgi:hypothetical protein
MEEQVGKWELLVFDNEYEIWNQYPFPVKRIKTNHICTESINNHGYVQVKIRRSYQRKHRLIAIQFIHNDDPENKTQIDHIDRDPLNNQLDNLRWCTQSENNKNRCSFKKQKHEYIQELPENAIRIENYDDIELDRYYYDPDSEKLYLKTNIHKVQYKLCKPSLSCNRLTIHLVDVNGTRFKRNYTKIMNELGDMI